MKYQYCFLRTPVSIQPELRLIDMFEESTEYLRNWQLPFNALSLTKDEDPEDPSWCELRESKRRIYMEKDTVNFTTVDTPMQLRYSGSNRHCAIHFRYELFPGVDLFTSVHDRYLIRDKKLVESLHAVFAEQDPLRRIAMAEHVVMKVVLDFWPEHIPLDFEKMQQFSELLKYVNTHLDSRFGVPEMAAFMGWSEAYFARTFHSVFHITPKKYLIRELLSRAMGLLKNTEKSIKQIAEELNFSSEFNFSRFVRHYCGYSPSEIRKNHRNVRK